jgi:hypothetical protein
MGTNQAVILRFAQDDSVAERPGGCWWVAEDKVKACATVCSASRAFDTVAGRLEMTS